MKAPDPETPLTSYGLRHLDLVLDERFGVPPPGLFPELPRPTTLAALAGHSQEDPATVDATLRRIAVQDLTLEITPAELAPRLAAREPGLVLVDVREPWEWDLVHLPGSILLATADYAALEPRLKEAKEVVAVCHHGVRSYSAAHWLRDRGVETARSLAGGLDLWARTIDPAMPRY